MTSPEHDSNKISRRGFTKYVAAGVVAAVGVGAAAYYGYFSRASQSPTSITYQHAIGLTPGLTLEAAKTQGFFQKHNLNPDITELTDFAIAQTNFNAGKFEFFHDASLAALANARGQGVNVLAIYPVTVATNKILVRKDSPYQSIYDLKAKSVGIYVPTPYSFIIGTEYWNKNHPSQPLDLLHDFSYSIGPPPLLGQNLLKGQVEAIDVYDPFVSSTLVQGARVLEDPNSDWKQLTGVPAVFGAMLAVQEAFANSNPNVTKEVVQTFLDARKYVLGNTSFIDDYIKKLFNYTDQSLIETLRNNAIQALSPLTWDESILKGTMQYLQLNQKYGIVKTVPTGLLTSAYVP